MTDGLLNSWYRFPEVKQTGSVTARWATRAQASGRKFAVALHEGLNTLFSDFGDEQITRGSHLEKLCLIKSNVGRDNISDFTTNLVKGYLCRYTQDFARAHLAENRVRRVPVRHVAFNYDTHSWTTEHFILPFIDDDYVLLTPKEILTKDDASINRHDLIGDFEDIANSVPNDELRAQINDYFIRALPVDANKEETDEAVIATIRQFPALIDYYIRYKEEHGEEAKAISEERVRETERVYIQQVGQFANQLLS